MIRVKITLENEVESGRVYRSEVSGEAMDETIFEVDRTLRQLMLAALLAADFSLGLVREVEEEGR